MKLVVAMLFSFVILLSCKKGGVVNKAEDGDKPLEINMNQGSTLSANSSKETYSLINSVFGGTGDVMETPDCAHPTVGPHIAQIYDDVLKKYVFGFQIHVTPDNDRCLSATDRQRNEIKTYDKSPDSLKGSLNETVKYSWKFKLDKDFKPSPNFSHLHQIKALDGDDDLPLITLTARYKSSGDQLEVIHTAGVGKTTSLKNLASIPLADFKGNGLKLLSSLPILIQVSIS